MSEPTPLPANDTLVVLSLPDGTRLAFPRNSNWSLQSNKEARKATFWPAGHCYLSLGELGVYVPGTFDELLAKIWGESPRTHVDLRGRREGDTP